MLWKFNLCKSPVLNIRESIIYTSSRSDIFISKKNKKFSFDCKIKKKMVFKKPVTSSLFEWYSDEKKGSLETQWSKLEHFVSLTHAFTRIYLLSNTPTSLFSFQFYNHGFLYYCSTWGSVYTKKKYPDVQLGNEERDLGSRCTSVLDYPSSLDLIDGHIPRDKLVFFYPYNRVPRIPPTYRNFVNVNISRRRKFLPNVYYHREISLSFHVYLNHLFFFFCATFKTDMALLWIRCGEKVINMVLHIAFPYLLFKHIRHMFPNKVIHFRCENHTRHTKKIPYQINKLYLGPLSKKYLKLTTLSIYKFLRYILEDFFL